MDPQPQQVFLSQKSAKLNSLNPFAQQYFDLFGFNLTQSIVGLQYCVQIQFQRTFSESRNQWMKVAESSLAMLKFNFGINTYLPSFLDLLIDLRSLSAGLLTSQGRPPQNERRELTKSQFLKTYPLSQQERPNGFKPFNTSKCLAMQIIVFGVGLKWEFHDDKLRV